MVDNLNLVRFSPEDHTPNDLIFYTTITGTRPFPKWLPADVNFLVSAGSLWSSTRSKFVRRSMGSHNLFFLDSGGFTCLNRFGEYPWTIDEYVDLIWHYQPDYVATMDYPCEPEINRSHHYSNIERIDKTVENTSLLLDSDLPDNTKLVPVLQGYSIDEYAYCIDRYRELGNFEYFGVGSVCRRIKVIELRKLIVQIADLVRSSQEDHTPKLHFFGLKLSALSDPLIYPHVYSCDSAAWTMKSGKLKFSRSDEHEYLWNRYIQKIDDIMRTSHTQRSIFQY